MEKALSPEEKIRRAEEIYYRRKMLDENSNYTKANIRENKKDFKLLKKMTIQILVCALIYTIFYTIKNKNYIFSEDILNKTKQILSYDINIPKIYEQLKEYVNSFTYIESEEIKEEVQDSVQDNEQNDNILENAEAQNQEPDNLEQNNNENSESIGGEEVQETIQLTQMEQDAIDIKNTKSLVIPLKGTITSRFGPRESENPIVSKNHTGIDIAANEGTVFIAAMTGTVEEVSNKRRIGKSHKNNK